MSLSTSDVLAGTGALAWVVGEDGSVTPARFSPADLERKFKAVILDSRQVKDRSLFAALPGERVDGHQFVGQALAGGASGAIVTTIPDAAVLTGARSHCESSEHRARPILFQVPDSVRALGKLAAFKRRQSGCSVVGITGSIGKTTTKEITAGLLASRWPTLKSDANQNTEIGLPLTLLRLEPQHQVAVLEMGMYVPGDIAWLAEVARPDIGIVTNVGPIHLERVGSIARIARAKSELVAALSPDGLAVLNGDDPWTRAMAQTSGIARAMLCGAAPDCDYRLLEVETRGLEGLSFRLAAEGRRVDLHANVAGAHTASAFLFAIAAARFLGMEWDEIEQAVPTVRLDERQRILQEPDGLLIIDDSYNAAPMSVKAALDLLRAVPGTRIAVLGDMLELGSYEESAHREVGARVARVADWLVVRGARGSWTAEEAEREGLPTDRVIRAASNAEAVQAIREIVMSLRRDEPSSPCAILVKGSRGMRMEEVVQGLRLSGATERTTVARSEAGRSLPEEEEA